MQLYFGTLGILQDTDGVFKEAPLYSGHPRFIRDSGHCIQDTLVFGRTPTFVIRDIGLHLQDDFTVSTLVVVIRDTGRYFQDACTDVIRDTGRYIQDTDGVFQDIPVWLRTCFV